MRTRAELSPEAEADLAEAFAYYEGQLPGLGHEFITTFEQQLDRIVGNPMLYQEVHRGVRRATMRRFPYALFYLVEDGPVVVLAVEHQARDPEHWKARL